MPLAYATDSLDAFLTNFGTPEAVVSSRYHGALVAAWHGSRLAVIARTAKLHGIVADLEVPALPAIDRADQLLALERDGVRVARVRLESLRARASAMCDEFFRWLGSRNAQQSARRSRTQTVGSAVPSSDEDALATD
jgi:polysaccharide pyruvyl transferase WcaK-like protein